ncbi:MAG: EVE domain-containing protein [Gammaproteobacteria bacterium]|nr:EVE domain-containing protein [Gammaproteobacteria bacterium]
MNYWLMKSEPSSFSIDDLKKRPNKTESWDGVRNYKARNMMRDQMQLKDLAFFYHSSCPEPGIAGIVEIVCTSHPDLSSLNPKSKYYDPKATPEDPRWYMVDVKFKKEFSGIILLQDLRNNKDLGDFTLLKLGNRLSIMPVTEKQWNSILAMAS